MLTQLSVFFNKLNSPSQNTHTDNFDAMRILASLAVLYGHSFPLSGVTSPAFLGNSVQTLSVKIFFVLSGYLVSESWRRDPSIVRYLTRRCLRIFPGLIAVILVTALIFGPMLTTLSLGNYFVADNFILYFKNIILNPSYSLPGVFLGNVYPEAVNGSLWSLPVEFFMYLLVPLVLIIGCFGERVRIILASLFLCVLSIYFVRTVPTKLVMYGTSILTALDVAPYFFMGMLWRLARHHWFNVQIALVLGFSLVLMPQDYRLDEIALYVALPYMILSFCLVKPAAFGWLGKWGDLSFGIYIYGFLIQQTVSSIFHTSGRPYLNFLLALFPTLVLATLSWHFLEKKFLAFKPRKITKICPH